MNEWDDDMEPTHTPPPKTSYKGYIIGGVIGAIITLILILAIFQPVYLFGPHTSKSPLIGKWNLDYAIINGKQINDVDDSYVVFMSNGDGFQYLHIPDLNITETVNFKWEDLGNNEIKTTVNAGDTHIVSYSNYSISGNQLIITGSMSYQGTEITEVDVYVRA